METRDRPTELIGSRLRAAVLVALAVSLYAIFAETVSRPLHAKGSGQLVLDYVNGLDHVLQFPGRRAIILAHYHPRPAVFPSAWLAMMLASGVFYGLAGALSWGAWLRLTQSRPAAPAISGYPDEALVEAALSRRRFLRRGAAAAGGVAAAGLGYSLIVEPRWFEVSHQVIRLRGLPPGLDGLRVVQLTDFHHGPWMARERVRELVEASNRLTPDLVFLTGDYVDQSPAYIKPAVEELARLEARIGVVAVLGNHDWREDGHFLQRQFEAHDIPLLDNTRCILTPARRLVREADEGLALAGVGDLWMDTQDYEKALAKLPAAMPRILLSHNPDVAEEPDLLDSKHRVDLIISGHTHGGQIYIPFVGTPMVPSRFGQKYAQGFVSGPICPVFVCRGVGLTGVPLRIGVPPEIAVLELRTGTG